MLRREVSARKAKAAIEQRLQLGEVIHPAGVPQEVQTQRGDLALQDQLAPLLEDALAGQTFHSDRAAQLRDAVAFVGEMFFDGGP